MKQLDEKTYWKYIDGECNPEERLQIENLLSDDPSLAEEMLLRSALHAEIDDMELELPSMDFSKNVMAALPEKRTISEVAPLVSKRMKIGFAAFMVLLFSGIFSIPFIWESNTEFTPLNENPITAKISTWFDALMLYIGSYIPELPNIPELHPSLMPLIMATLVGFVILAFFDALGRKMWHKKLGV